MTEDTNGNLTVLQKAQVASLVRALHAANSQGKTGNPYLVHGEALKGAASLLGVTVTSATQVFEWADKVGPDCTGD